MRTRSQTRNRNRRQQQQTLPVVVEPCNLQEPIPGPTIVAMADRTMEELLRAPTEGYGEAIVLPEINADHFEIKTNLLQLVQENPFQRNVPNDVIKLMMFPYSLEGAAKTCDHNDCDPEEDIYVLEQLLNDEPFQLPPMDLKQSEVTEAKSSIEEPPELELKDLPSHLEYAFLEENDKLPVIIAKGLKNDQKEALINILKSHKRAIAWKITDIKDTSSYLDGEYVSIIGSFNERLRKNIFPLPFKDQIARTSSRNEFYCFLDGYRVSDSNYPQDQEKITFTETAYGTFAYRRIPFGLCNAPGKLSNVVYGDYSQYDRKDNGDFSKISRPITHLLEKEHTIVFSQDCINAFETLKKKLTETPILVVPDWEPTFRNLMCDASDYRLVRLWTTLRRSIFQPTHYAVKTIPKAQIHYTTTEKEMLAVVYAFEKFRPYLVLSKSIVYTDQRLL
ncbi:reverse transcriptase domain-containing protein [Tanacetum coccineum]